MTTMADKDEGSVYVFAPNMVGAEFEMDILREGDGRRTLVVQCLCPENKAKVGFRLGNKRAVQCDFCGAVWSHVGRIVTAVRTR